MALKPGQRACIETLDKSLVVAAGAGSGKTFTLTKRIVGALESGYVDDIGSVCAITFTNKAAAELKSRVKSELRARGLAEQSLKVDDAWISTIHGMCARILRSHAVELGIDPEFKVADGRLSNQLLEQAIDEVISEAQGARQDVPEATPAAFGGQLDAGTALALEDLDALFEEHQARTSGYEESVEVMLKRLVELASAHVRGSDAFAIGDAQEGAGPLVRKVLESFGELLASAQAENQSSKRDAWIKTAESSLVYAHGMVDQGGLDAPAALEALSGLSVSKGFGSKAFKEQAAACEGVLKACVMELRLRASLPHARTLASLASKGLERFEAKKRAEGVLDNNDLLVGAARALEANPGIAAQYADRFKLVMVDEFQDTDQLQVDMIKRIAGPDACRLCVVGDAQQSIYRFRGADVSVYERHVNVVRGADASSVIQLPDNFRSHADVLAFVDVLFEQPDMFGSSFMSLAASRDETRIARPLDGDFPRIVVQQTTKEYRGVPKSEVVRKQAQRIAELFAGLHAQGHPAGDMAVLLGRMSQAGVYAQALREQGLACVVSGGSVFASTPEAQIMLELARVAANIHDTQALRAVLSSPVLLVTDDDFLALATAVAEDGVARRRHLDVGLEAVARALDGDGAELEGCASVSFAHAVKTIRRLQYNAVRHGLADALMQAVVDSGWISRLQGQGPEGLASAANVYKAIRIIGQAELEDGSGPVGAMRSYEEMLEVIKEPPGALSTTGGDFVRIMTVHASKGLEFPIVAVSEFPQQRAGSSKLVAVALGDSIHISLDAGKSLERLGGSCAFSPVGLYPALVESCQTEEDLIRAALSADDLVHVRAALSVRDQIGEEEELKRLLYVALTRAKECAVVSFGGQRTKNNPNGIPSNCLAMMVHALERSGLGFDPGIRHYGLPTGGSVLVEHVALVAGQAGSAGSENAGSEEFGAAAGPSDSGPSDNTAAHGNIAEGFTTEGSAADCRVKQFEVPVFRGATRALRIPYALPHEGMFSYSMLAASAKHESLVGELAERYVVSCDPAALAGDGVQGASPLEVHGQGQMARAGEAGCEDGQAVNRLAYERALAAQGEGDDGSFAYLGAVTADEDKATDLGTAFHRLAQLAVCAHAPGQDFAMPAQERIDALAFACGLADAQKSRLLEALQRWFASSLAHEAASWPQVAAELPFVVPLTLPGGQGCAGEPSSAGEPDNADVESGRIAYLEGEIDLLCIDETARTALVVDYKTGGRENESAEELACKHVLQACCYARAVLVQGIEQVEAVFVRVEHPRAGDSAQPQCVRYSFASSDADALEDAIVRAYSAVRDTFASEAIVSF